MVRKGCKRLQKSIARCQRSAAPENVHRLRRAIRHMRMLLDICQRWEKDERWRPLHDRLRQVLHALGALRDLQVRVELLSGLSATDPHLAPLLRRAMKEEREERRAVSELLAQLELTGLAKLRRRLKRHWPIGALRTALMRTIAAERRELLARWKALRSEDPRSMHRLRVAVRRIGLLLAAMEPYLHSGPVGNLPVLHRMQVRLGQVHDMQLLVDWGATEVMKLPAAQRKRIQAYLETSARSIDRRMALFARQHPVTGAGNGVISASRKRAS